MIERKVDLKWDGEMFTIKLNIKGGTHNHELHTLRLFPKELEEIKELSELIKKNEVENENS